MKKIFISMCMALVGLCAAAQEQGDMAVGINLGVAPSVESGASVTNFDLGAKFQYNVTAPIRLEADLDYGFKNKGISILTFGINAHYLINVADKFKMYPLVGLGYANCKASWKTVDFDFEDILSYYMPGAYIPSTSSSESVSRFFFNIGVGGEYAITDQIALNLEVKYQYIKDFSRIPILLGATYKF